LLIFGILSVVQAQENSVFEPEGLAEARELLQEKEAKKALKQLEKAEAELACPQRVIDKDVLASIWVYKGYAYHLLGKNDDVILAEWDQAFAMNIGIQFNEEVLSPYGSDRQANEDILNYFEAHRRMAEGFGGLDLQVPEKVGEAKLYIDGRPAVPGEVVHPGLHLAQIVCPEDSLQSRWSTFEDTFDWFAMCPSGVDVSQAEESDDPFFGFVGGGSSSVIDDVVNPDPICVEVPSKKSGVQLSIQNPKATALIGSGVLLLASGTYTYYGMTIPRYEAIEAARAEPGNITEAEAELLTKEFNTARFLTLGLLGGGLAVLGTGTYSMLQVTPNWIGISGQF